MGFKCQTGTTRSERRFCLFITTSHSEPLRRPLESAEKTWFAHILKGFFCTYKICATDRAANTGMIEGPDLDCAVAPAPLSFLQTLPLRDLSQQDTRVTRSLHWFVPIHCQKNSKRYLLRARASSIGAC